MLLHIFVGSLLPYIEELDSWVFEGILDDPFEEVNFLVISFYACLYFCILIATSSTRTYKFSVMEFSMPVHLHGNLRFFS